MALNRGNLGFTTQVGSGVTSAVLTVGSAQTCYVKSILMFNRNQTATQNAVIYVVENSGGSAGTASSIHEVARIGITTNDTFFFEPAYPITLNTNGDTIQIYNEGNVTDSLNVLVLGDKEV